MATEFVGIQLELLGEEGVRKALQDITKLANSLGGRKKVDMGLKDINKQLLEAQGNLRKYQKEEREAVKGSDEWHTAKANIQATKDKIAELNATAKIAKTTLKDMGKTFQQTATSIASKARQWGGTMQSLGNAMVRMTSPFTNLASGMVIGAGFKAINTITEGLSNGFERADTMRKFPRVMEAMGYSAEKSQASISKLEQSVLGLPTGLDEMVTMAQRFTSSMGDLEKGTELAIATNNAFLASMSTDTQKYQGMMQLQDVIGGKDMNAREWQALANSMLPAIRMMGESLGYEGKALDEYVASVQRGEVANEDFIATLIKAGTDSQGKIRRVAEESMDTWEAFFSRIRTASSNLMFRGIIEPLDELVNVVTGGKFKSLNLLLDDFIYNGIGKMRNEVAEWIRSHPEQITEFFRDLKSIDIKSFGKGLLEGFSIFAKGLQMFSKMVGNRDLSTLGRRIVYFNVAGRAISTFGALLRGLSQPIGILGALGLKIGKVGIFGKIASLFTGLRGAKAVADATDSLDKIPTFTQSLRKAVWGMSGAFKVFGTVALGAGTAWLSIRTVRDGLRMLREIAKEWSEMSSEEWIYAGGAMAGFGTFVLALSKAASAVGTSMSAITSLGEFFALPAIKGGLIIGGITTFVTGLIDLNAHFVAGSFRAFRNAISWLKEGLEGLKEVGKIHVNVSKVETQLDLMKQVMGIFNKPYEADEHSGGSGGGGSIVTRAAMVKTMSEIIGNTKKAMTDLNSLPNLDETQIEAAKTKVNNTLSAMRGIYNELINPDGTETEISKGSSSYQQKRSEGVVHAVAEIIKSIKDSLADLKELESLNVKLDQAKTNAVEVGTKMGEIYSALNTAFGREVNVDQDIEGVGTIRGSYNEGVSSTVAKEAGYMQTTFEAFANAIGYIRDAYQKIMGGEGDMDLNVDAFQEKMDGITGDGGIVAMLRKMFEQLKTGFGDNDVDIQTPMEEFANAIGSVRTAVKTLQKIEGIEFEGEEGVGGVINQIGSMVTQLKSAFDPTIVQGVIEQITGFITVVDNLFEQIQTMQGMSKDNPIQVDITFNHTINGKNEVVKAIQVADYEIRTAVSSIKKVYNEYIVVNLIPRVNKYEMPDTSYPYTGGLIGGYGKVLYRSKGGDIFKPRGTDTVPAMLTPGEYVHRRRAVDFFGIDFMRKINNLDVRGAMADLMTMAGHMANAGNQTIINNTYNNNQKVYQNVNTNSPDFAFKSASRFAGAF